MAYLFRSILSSLLSLTLLLGTTTPAFAQSNVQASGQSPAQSAGTELAATPTELAAQEAMLISEIDAQADVVFKEFQKTYPKAPLSFLKKAQREIVYRLKQMHVLTDILKASGPAPATTLLAVEVLTTFVFAPLATAMGKPAVAGAMVVVPWGIAAGFGVFSYQMLKVRRNLAKELKVSSLKEFDQIRKVVVGYDIKNRISSAMYQSLKGNTVEFEILRKAVSPATTKTPSITIAELEAMVTSQVEGAQYLQAIYMEKLDPMYYSALLLRFVNNNEGLTSQLVATLSAREKLGSDQSSSVRKYLMASDDIQNQIEREIKKIQLEKIATKKRVKAREMTKDEAKELKKHLASELTRIQAVRHQVTRAEYMLLIESKSALAEANQAALGALVTERQTQLNELAGEARVSEFKASKRSLSPILAGNRCFDLFAFSN
ncbi:MAG: hypothetical protein EOP05_09255 [Proteobacteria bacterium]|nr:MAG: hypothetical protein EOP05_09255 [Pseudomonadota bacterium]